MRLLDTKSFQLREFEGSEVPSYAILSHCWGEAEVLFDDVQDLDRARKKTGFSKIKRCCEEAHQLGYSWVWIDTCCIDKSSSAELSEAINSMHNWYRLAGTCLVYMDDVDVDDIHPQSSLFRLSRWFTRGWTLQELLAPEHVVFFSKTWSHLGTKQCLVKVLHEITKVPVEALVSGTRVHSFSVAQRMSWAATRRTTRVEDRAYSLMGLFDIFMPIIYGEGAAAFTRLQLEIIQRSSDQTIFAWSGVKPKVRISPQLKLSGHEEYERKGRYLSTDPSVLATSPADFKHSRHIVHLMRLPTVSFGKTEFSSTNLGIRIRVPLVSMQLGDGEAFLWILPCRDRAEGFICGIVLRSDSSSLDSYQSHAWKSDRLVRIPEDEYNELAKRAELRIIYVSTSGGRRSYPWAPASTEPSYDHYGEQAIEFRPRHNARLLVILGKHVLVKLEESGYFFAGCASWPDNVKHWSVKFGAGGDLLLEYRLDSEDAWNLRLIDDKNHVLCHKDCISFHTSHVHVLFRNYEGKPASLLVANPSGGADVRRLLMEVAGHSNDHINADEVCDQYSDGRRVGTTRRTEYNRVEKIEYTTFWIEASSFFRALIADLERTPDPL